MEHGDRGEYDGHKQTKGTRLHLAGDTLGQLLAMTVTAANDGDRAQVKTLSEAIQTATGDAVAVVHIDQGDTGPTAEDAADSAGIRLEMVRLPVAKRGFVHLPRCWVVDRSFGWLSRFRRLAKDCERLEETAKGMHLVAFGMLRLGRGMQLLAA